MSSPIPQLPPRTFDPHEYEFGGPGFMRELNAFNALRERTVQQQLQQVGALTTITPTPAMWQEVEMVNMDWTDDDLLGAATFWGIPYEQAIQTPREELVQFVETQRRAARPSDAESSALINGLAPLGALGAGALQMVTRGIRNLPFVGEAFSKIELAHKANVFMNSLEEGVRASTPESISPVLTTFEVGGNIAALIAPGVIAWKAAGALGAVVPYAARLSPIVRGAARGLVSTALLEGGNPDENQRDLALIIGTGAGALGPVALAAWARWSPAARAAANKTARSYVPNMTVLGPQSPAGFAPDGFMSNAFTGGPGGGGSGGGGIADDLIEGLELSRPFEGGAPLSALPEGFETLPEPLRDELMRVFSSIPETTPRTLPTSTARAADNFQRVVEEVRRRGNLTTQQKSALEALLRRSGQPQNLSLAGDLASADAAAGAPPRLFTTEAAEANAVGLNKASTVLNSPVAPLHIAQPILDDVTVARAAMETNPGGSNIVQGVTDPAGFAARVVDETAAYVRYARPRGTNRLDALVSDTPITNKMVTEYEKHGVYSTQSVVTRNGLQGEVVRIDGTLATVRLVDSDATVQMSVSKLKPSPVSPGMHEAPEVWDKFLDYAQGRAAASGMQIVPNAGITQVDTVLSQNMPQYLDDFLDTMGSITKGDRAKLTRYFNKRFVEEFKRLAPVESVLAERATKQAMTILDNTESLGYLSTLDELAAANGMLVSPARGGGITLIDNAGGAGKGTELAFDGLESAEQWLRTNTRELADITPRTAVPVELSPMQYTAAPQAPNGNGVTGNGIVDEIFDIAAEEGDGIVNAIAAEAAVLRESGSLSKLNSLYVGAFNNLQSMRRLAGKVDEAFHAFGLDKATFFRDYLDISGASAAQHNYLAPFQIRASEIMGSIRAKSKRSGIWTQMYLIEDPIERVRLSKLNGLNDAEIKAMDDLSAYWHEVFQETGLPVERELRQYLPMLQKMQSIDDFAGAELWKVSTSSDAFFKHVRRGSINTRELDPETLIHHYLRELGWENHMAAKWEPIASKWNSLKQQVPELMPAADIMLNYLHTVRYGYQPGMDQMLDFAHATAQMLIGPSVTRAQARHLVNKGLNLTYSSLMGYSPHIIARDLQQIWFALPRTGTDLIGTMKSFMTGSNAVRQAMWDSAVADDLVSLVHPRSMAPGTGRSLEAAALDPLETAAGTASTREVALGNALAAVEDVVPKWMKSEKLRPTYLYGRQGEIVRMLVGTAQKTRTIKALSNFRAAGERGSMGRLLEESGADSFMPAVRREFERLVTTGMDDEAAKFLARQQADASQFRYHSGEGAAITRNTTGKIGMQLGSYFFNYAQYLDEIVRYGTPAVKAKTLATFATVTAAFAGASKLTGWNFNKMNPFFGIGFTGGPILDMGMELARGISANIRDVTGQNESGITPPSVGSLVTDAAQLFNPTAGAFRLFEGLGMATESPSPGLATTRLLITGQRGIGPDLGNDIQLTPDVNAFTPEMLPQMQPQFQQSLQMMQGPVRMEAYGTPQIPQQPATVIDPNMVVTPDSSGLPPVEVLRELGVSDPSKVYYKNGNLVYDTPNGGTHALSEAGRLLRPGQTWEQREAELMGRPADEFRNTRVVRDISALDQPTQIRVLSLMDEAARQGLDLQVMETRRPQTRQDYLFAQGRNPEVPGNRVTWSLTSAHGDGRAIDILVNGDMSGSDPGYIRLHELAKRFGLVAIGGNDPGHLSMTDSSRAATPQYDNPGAGGGGAQF